MRSNPTAADSVDETVPKTLIDAAYRQLMHDIVECKLAPGDKLRIADLKQAYQVSGGTVREALSLLVSQSLVVAEDQRGFRVAPMSLADLKDLTRMRVMLECAALGESISVGNDDWEAAVVSRYHKLSLLEGRPHTDASFREWEQRNAEFHEALLSACDSPWMLRFRGVLYQQLKRYRRLTAIKAGGPSRSAHDEHAEIFDAAIKRDIPRATAALAAHIQATLQFTQSLQLLGETGSRSPANGK